MRGRSTARVAQRLKKKGLYKVGNKVSNDFAMKRANPRRQRRFTGGFRDPSPSPGPHPSAEIDSEPESGGGGQGASPALRGRPREVELPLQPWRGREGRGFLGEAGRGPSTPPGHSGDALGVPWRPLSRSNPCHIDGTTGKWGGLAFWALTLSQWVNGDPGDPGPSASVPHGLRKMRKGVLGRFSAQS